MKSYIRLARSAETDFAKGFCDQLAAEGIVANQLLSEVLPRFCEAHDHRPISAGERDRLFGIGITIHYTMLFRVASIGPKWLKQARSNHKRPGSCEPERLRLP